VAGTGVLPAQPTDIPTALAATRQADVVILYLGGKAGWYGDDLTEKEGVTPRVAHGCSESPCMQELSLKKGSFFETLV